LKERPDRKKASGKHVGIDRAGIVRHAVAAVVVGVFDAKAVEGGGEQAGQ
jgi:hypothetical protein